MNRLHRYFLYFILGLFMINVSVLVLKNVVKRPRPTTILSDYSFPSAHAANAFFVAAYLASFPFWQTKKNQQAKFVFQIILYTTAVLIGLSRVYLQVHYLSDVVTGGIIGLVFAKALIYHDKIR